MPALIGAAFRDQEVGQGLNPRVIHRTQDAPPVAALRDQFGRDQLFQMMRQDRACHANGRAQIPDGQTVRPGPDKAAQDGQPVFRAKRRKGRGSPGEFGQGVACLLHDSIFIEIKNESPARVFTCF